MNNKTFLKSFAGLFLLSVLVTSCSKDDNNDSKSYFIVGDSTKSLSAGVIENYGYDHYNNSYNIDLFLVSSGVNIGTDNNGEFYPTGQGVVVYLEMYTSSGTALDEGEYQYSDTYTAKTFEFGEYCVNWTFGVNSTLVDFVAGIIKVTRDGDTYEITLNMVDENGKTVKGYYKGALTLFDYDTPVKSTEPRHKRLW